MPFTHTNFLSKGGKHIYIILEPGLFHQLMGRHVNTTIMGQMIALSNSVARVIHISAKNIKNITVKQQHHKKTFGHRRLREH